MGHNRHDNPVYWIAGLDGEEKAISFPSKLA
jgi:hypothetical protein